MNKASSWSTPKGTSLRCNTKSMRLCAEEPAGRRVQSLEAALRHANQPPDLSAGGLISRDDVRLHDHRHVPFERPPRQRPDIQNFVGFQ